MSVALDENGVAAVLDSIYDAAVEADGWPRALGQLAALFNSHFADLFARTDDWREFQGIAVGLDRADYDDEFLGKWTSRNVWTQASPAQIAGEVKPTWQMVTKQEVLRSAIYNDYLRHRDLNEGLRLVLWSGEGWLQDISLLRPWAAGPYEGPELRLAPHAVAAFAAGCLDLPQAARARCARDLRYAGSARFPAGRARQGGALQCGGRSIAVPSRWVVDQEAVSRGGDVGGHGAPLGWRSHGPAVSGAQYPSRRRCRLRKRTKAPRCH